MAETLCISCRRPNAKHKCGICEEPVCKSCAQFLPAESFPFLTSKPEHLTHTYYCPACHSEKVAPEIESYDEIMSRAKEAFIFFTTQKAGLPILKKAKVPVKVEQCPDRDEAILRLAFAAAQAQYNCVVEVDVAHQKIREGAYQTTNWRAQGFPAEIDAVKMQRRIDGNWDD